MMNIEDIIRSLIDQYRSIDFVESEFLRMISDDMAMKKAYEEWCGDLGYSVKYGYIEYIKEVFESDDSIWGTLTEFEDID